MDKHLRVAVCEDSDVDARLLQAHIEQSGVPVLCERFASGEALLRVFCAGQYDLIFMDIYMSGMRGVEAARTIREADGEVVIAFTTTSLDHALESYRLGALKYMEKPVQPDSVKETLELALLKRRSRPCIDLTVTGGSQETVLLESILYFEQQGHVVQVHTLSGTLTTTQSVKMSDIEGRLPQPPFLRCHRSYLVNLNHVHKIDREIHAFLMKNGDRADIRRGGLTQCVQELDSWRLAAAGRVEI